MPRTILSRHYYSRLGRHDATLLFGTGHTSLPQSTYWVMLHASLEDKYDDGFLAMSGINLSRPMLKIIYH